MPTEEEKKKEKEKRQQQKDRIINPYKVAFAGALIGILSLGVPFLAPVFFVASGIALFMLGTKIKGLVGLFKKAFGKNKNPNDDLVKEAKEATNQDPLPDEEKIKEAGKEKGFENYQNKICDEINKFAKTEEGKKLFENPKFQKFVEKTTGKTCDQFLEASKNHDLSGEKTLDNEKEIDLENVTPEEAEKNFDKEINNNNNELNESVEIESENNYPSQEVVEGEIQEETFEIEENPELKDSEIPTNESTGTNESNNEKEKETKKEEAPEVNTTSTGTSTNESTGSNEGKDTKEQEETKKDIPVTQKDEVKQPTETEKETDSKKDESSNTDDSKNKKDKNKKKEKDKEGFNLTQGNVETIFKALVVGTLLMGTPFLIGIFAAAVGGLLLKYGYDKLVERANAKTNDPQNIVRNCFNGAKEANLGNFPNKYGDYLALGKNKDGLPATKEEFMKNIANAIDEMSKTKEGQEALKNPGLNQMFKNVTGNSLEEIADKSKDLEKNVTEAEKEIEEKEADKLEETKEIHDKTNEPKDVEKSDSKELEPEEKMEVHESETNNLDGRKTKSTMDSSIINDNASELSNDSNETKILLNIPDSEFDKEVASKEDIEKEKELELQNQKQMESPEMSQQQ